MIKNLCLIIFCTNSIAMAENMPEPGLATPAYTPPTVTYSQPVYTPPTVTYSQPVYTPPTVTYSQPVYTQSTETYYARQIPTYTNTRYRYPMVTSQLGYPNHRTINFSYGTTYLRRR